MTKIEKLYEGKIYSIYAICENNKCHAIEFIHSLEELQRKRIMFLLKRCADFDIPNNIEKFRNIDTGLWEFKAYDVRIFCTFDRGRIILLANGFIKKSQKTPINEIEKAKRILKNYFKEKYKDEL